MLTGHATLLPAGRALKLKALFLIEAVQTTEVPHI